jgi:hypothetical protein
MLSLSFAVLEITESYLLLDLFHLCLMIIIPLMAVIIGIIGKKREQTKSIFPTLGIALNSIWLSLVILVISWLLWPASEIDELSAEMARIGFFESAPLKIGSKKWTDAYNNHSAFIVEVNDSISVHKSTNDEPNKKEISYEVGNVKYIGVNLGEFGGGIYINEYNETNPPFFKGNIEALLPVGNDLYIVEGLAHMSHSRGSVHVIRNCKTPSAPERITLLPSAPEVTLLQPNNEKIIMASRNNIMILSLNYGYSLDVIHQDVFWRSLHPTSIQLYKDWYIFGIRSGVIATKAHFDFNRSRYFTLDDK